MKKGKEFEALIAKIYKELSPEATITLNDKIKGRDTGGEREIDVSIRSNVAGHDILIVVQAKDHKTPADINIVGEFKSVIQDIGASKGILICSSGFTKRALEYGKNAAIDLCTIHDAESRNWKLDLKIPVLVADLEEQLSVSLEISANDDLIKLNAGKPINIPTDLRANFSYDKGKNKFTVLDIIKEMKDKNQLPLKAGKYTLDLYRSGLEILIETVYAPITRLLVTYNLIKKGHLKFFDANGYRGIKNVLTEGFNPSFLSVQAIIPFKNFDATWEQVNPDEIAITPITLTVELSVPMEPENFTQTHSEVKIPTKKA